MGTTQNIYVEIAITSVASLLGGALMLVIPALTNTVWGIQNFPMWVIGVTAGLFIGYLTFKLERTIFITATSAGGAFLFVACLSYYLKPDLTAQSNQRWIYLGIMVVSFLLGLLIQFMYTAPKEKKKKEADMQRNLLEYEQSNNLGYGATNTEFRNNPVYEQA